MTFSNDILGVLKINTFNLFFLGNWKFCIKIVPIKKKKKEQTNKQIFGPGIKKKIDAQKYKKYKIMWLDINFENRWTFQTVFMAFKKV